MNTQSALKSIALVVSVAASALAQDAPTSVTLKYQMTTDAPLTYKTASKIKHEKTVNGQKLESEMNVNETAVRTLLATEDNGALRFSNVIKRLTVRADTGPAGKYSFDSDAPNREQSSTLAKSLTPVFAAMASTEFTYTITPQGKVQAVTGHKELLKQIAKSDKAAAGLQNDDQTALHGAAEFLVPFADRAVGPGSKWEVPFELELPNIGKIQGKRIFLLESMTKYGERDAAKILETYEMSLDTGVTSGRAEVSGTLTADGSQGTILFDPAAGVLLSNEREIVISGRLTRKIGDQTINVDLKQTQTVSTKLVEGS